MNKEEKIAYKSGYIAGLLKAESLVKLSQHYGIRKYLIKYIAETYNAKSEKVEDATFYLHKKNDN